jgi:hypothetical protein
MVNTDILGISPLPAAVKLDSGNVMVFSLLVFEIMFREFRFRGVITPPPKLNPRFS